MFRYFTKTDGMKVYLRDEDILGYEELECSTLVMSIIGEFEVINTLEEIFNKQDQKFSNN